MTAATDPHHEDSQAYLPDFCAAGTLFIVVLVAELVAIVLTLAAYDTRGMFLIELSKTSFFILWSALLGTALMCQLKVWLENAGKTRAFNIRFVVLEAMGWVLAEASWWRRRICGPSRIMK